MAPRTDAPDAGEVRKDASYQATRGRASRPARRPSAVLAAGVAALLSLFLLPLLIPRALAATTLNAGYPTLPISLTLPFGEEDQGDAFASAFLPALQAAAGNGLTLTRRPGRSGGYAVRALLGKPADGHFVALLSLPSFQLQAQIPNPLYIREDVAPLAVLVHAPAALWVPENSPLASLQDLIALARSQESSATSSARIPASDLQPQGVPLIMAGSGSATDGQMLSLALARNAGIHTRYLPFISTAKAAEAVLNGPAAVCIGYALSTPPLPGMRALAVASAQRSPALPGIPTFREQGLDMLLGQDLALGMPAGADPDDMDVISRFFLNILDDVSTRNALIRSGFTLLPIPHDETAAFLGRQDQRLRSFLEQYPLMTPAR